MQFLDSDWPANILAELNFQDQENHQNSPDDVCAISTGPAGHKNASLVVLGIVFWKFQLIFEM